MKTDALVIRRYDRVDQNLKALIDLHKSIFSGTNFENKLIYFNSSFKAYLTKIVSERGHYFYVVELNDNLIGFLHIREIEGILFLNHIAIDNRYSGKGIGKKIWKFCLKELSLNHSKETKFCLDVFKSNANVLAWYERLGFQTIFMKIWLEFKIKYDSENNIANDFSLKKDENGFPSIFKNEKKIATYLDNNIILHDISYLDAIINKDVKVLLSIDNKVFIDIYINSSYDFEILDSSVRLSTTVGGLLEKFNSNNL